MSSVKIVNVLVYLGYTHTQKNLYTCALAQAQVQIYVVCVGGEKISNIFPNGMYIHITMQGLTCVYTLSVI